MKILEAIREIGQSLWLDYIRRGALKSGELKKQVEEQGIRGLTSNPSIFEQAIARSDDYDEALSKLAAAGKSTEEIYETLAVEDIQQAADILRPVFDESDGQDGFVSLEVSPHLAFETKKTVSEAKRLRGLVDRPNLLVKVPATAEGLPAIQQLISEGVSVNVTLIFSLQQYLDVHEAYIAGLEQRLKAGKPLSNVASVASFFVSRIDGAVDAKLPETSSHRGRTAISNAKVAYQHHLETLRSDRWQALKKEGATVQRMLWASTSTKDPSYSDVLYVDNLIGPKTVNTLPPKTHQAFLDHGVVSLSLAEDLATAKRTLQGLSVAGVNLDEVCAQLLQEGVEKFAVSYDKLLAAVEEARKAKPAKPAKKAEKKPEKAAPAPAKKVAADKSDAPAKPAPQG